MEKIFHLVRLHELVPAGKTSRVDDLPRDASHRGDVVESDQRIHADFVERYVRVFSGVVRRSGDGVDGDVDVRVFRERLGWGSRGFDYGDHPGAYDEVHRGWVR